MSAPAKHHRHRRQLSFLLVLLVVLCTVLWLSRQGPNPTSHEDVPVDKSVQIGGVEAGQPLAAAAEETDETVGGKTDEAEPPVETEKPAEAVKEPAVLRVDEAWDAGAERFGELVRSTVQPALNGDLDAAMTLMFMRQRCDMSMPYVDLSVEQRVEIKQELFELRQKLTGDFLTNEQDDPFAWRATREENRALVERWDAACQDLAALHNSAFRERLDRMAEAGHVMARFLYATWPPRHMPVSETTVSLLEKLEWEEKARRYSALNLEQGEIAGLMAFAHSYSWGLFTAMNWELGSAFQQAAFDCGLRGEWYEKMGDFVEDTFVPDYEARVRAQAESLATFCRE